MELKKSDTEQIVQYKVHRKPYQELLLEQIESSGDLETVFEEIREKRLRTQKVKKKKKHSIVAVENRESRPKTLIKRSKDKKEVTLLK